jgi:hypothetical protein
MKNELELLVPAGIDPIELSGAAAHCAVILPVAQAHGALAACLASLVACALKQRDDGTPAAIYVVLAGHDGESAAIASQYPVHVITTDQTDAARMRTIGARAAVSAGAHWLAFTEPSAVVSETWLKDQLACGAAVILGAVEVTNQFLLSERTADSSAEVAQDEEALDCANFGLDARAFVLYQHITERGGGIDGSLARRLKGLGVSIRRCDMPHVYRRLEDCPDYIELLPDFARSTSSQLAARVSALA